MSEQEERDLKKLYYMSPTAGSSAMRVVSAGDKGPGGAYHIYRIDVGTWSDPDYSDVREAGLDPEFVVSDSFEIKFQVGPFGENRPNGITSEALLLVLIAHLKGFQAPGSPFPTRETACAITKLEEAQMWLQSRQHDRLLRGVQGLNKK